VAIRSIRVKVISVIIVVLALSVGFSIYITVTNQRSNLLDETRKNLTVTSEILNNVIRNIMLSGEAPIATGTLADIQEIEEFTDVSIYRTDGTNAFHDSATIDRVNMFIGREAFEPTERADLQMIDNTHFQEVLATNTPVDVESPKEQRFEYFFPILNYAECRSCHGDTGFIRGVAHYEVSTARIYEQITDARNTLTIFFVVSGVVIAFVLFIMLRRIIINPLLMIGSAVEKVGGGDLDITVEARSQDELGSLAFEINDMIGGLRDKSRLEIENSVIETRNQENRKYLENINEGLLLLDKDQRISEQYSTFLESLFGTGEVEGISFSEFIYPGESGDSEVRKELDEFIDMIFSNLNTDMEMIMSINPLADKSLVVERDGRRQEIIINATFLRIMTTNESVENVMVIFEDKTALAQVEKELESERIRSETEIEHIQAILRSGPESFIEFVSDAEAVLQSLEAGMESLDDSDTLNRLFRELHSLKGVGRYMELRSFAGTLHDAEGIIAGVRDGSRSVDPGLIAEIGERLETLRGEVDGIRSINDRFKDFAADGDGKPAGAVKELLENLERMATDIAGELGKTVQVTTKLELETIPKLKELRDPIIHVLRNSLDHGIEDGLERISKGKDEAGRIEINVLNPTPETCVIEIGDDGAGIDFQAVAKRAVEMGILGADTKPTNAQVLKVLFLPAFSSRTTASELSGRGVGLDAVHSAMSKLGGMISVATRKDVGTKISLKVPL
jgi:HAMP domain-containing protein